MACARVLSLLRSPRKRGGIGAQLID